MFTDKDLQSAVAAGAITSEAADALRAHLATSGATAQADEENIRLVTSFNDIFVGVACLLVIFSGTFAGGVITSWMGGLLVAVASWAMAEIFTRKRRMALPSIIVLVSFVVGLGFFAGGLAAEALPQHAVYHQGAVYEGKQYSWESLERYPWQDAVIALSAAVAAALGAIAHWLRFRVAITIAAGTGALVLLVLSALAGATGMKLDANPVLAPAALACGLAVFAFAMGWDLSDRERRTQRADIAFWLHLLAAPLIAHPLFYWIGVLDHTADRGDPATGIGVLIIYAFFAIVALVADRRALLVSALLYVLVALNGLLDQFGKVEAKLALATLVVGCALLGLSVFWAPLRRLLLGVLPAVWRERLPPSV